MKILVLFGVLAVLMLMGVPVVYSIGLTSVVYNILFEAFKFTQLPTRMYATNDSFIYLAIPLFILSGYIMEKGGISRKLVDFVYKLLGRVPGALGSVTVVACMIFAALTGSGAATVAAIGSIMYPMMIENGYSKSFSAGLIACAGALGPIIPPSIPMVVYASTMGVSVGDMFIGGVVPGVLMGIGFIIINTIYAIRHKLPRNHEKFNLKETLIAFWKALGVLFLPVMILGGIYGGLLTPTEAATFAVIYSLLLTILYRTFTFKGFYQTCVKSVMSAATIMAIINVSGIFGYIISTDHISEIITAFMVPLLSNKYIYLGLLFIFLLILGAVMDTAPAILIFAPILVPIGVQFGLDPLWLGIVFAVILITGLMTPPFGITLFAMSSTVNIKFEQVVKGAVPFIVAAIVVLLMITFIPGLATVLL